MAFHRQSNHVGCHRHGLNALNNPLRLLFAVVILVVIILIVVILVLIVVIKVRNADSLWRSKHFVRHSDF